MLLYNCQEGNRKTIAGQAGKGVDMEDMKEFVAYSKKLLRVLKKIKLALTEKNYDEVEKLVDELIEDTEGDIQA